MRRKVIYLALLLMVMMQATAQQVVQNKQRHFKKAVPAGNYSGVTWLGGDRYAVCNDKSATAGFLLMTIRLDSITGKIEDVRADSFMTSNLPNRDEEGICYVAPTNTLFLSGESDGEIVESTLDGRLTGRKLNIPDVFGVSHGNKGFEALTYNAKTHRFWTTTENTLKSDGEQPSIKKKSSNLACSTGFSLCIEMTLPSLLMKQCSLVPVHLTCSVSLSKIVYLMSNLTPVYLVISARMTTVSQYLAMVLYFAVRPTTGLMMPISSMPLYPSPISSKSCVLASSYHLI